MLKYTWAVTDVPRADAFADSRRLRLFDATDVILGARLDQSIQANKHRRPDSAEFRVGNQVYLSTKNLAFPPGQSRKFLARYIGPFTIVAAHPRFHASLLRPHFPNDDKRFPGRSFQQCVIEDAADPASDFAAIDVVLNNRFRNNRRSFLVRFVGRPDADDVWIDEAVLRLQAPSRLDEYIRRLDRQGRQLAGPTPRRRVNSGGG
ncbi:BQ5605_C011g06569 [Microbotryum silenes-dioicae]|uniref:BQ5605_C011g06569 protein n=1 Tax=Microbotryum silenes-dioicae TaxID=796604 RepID=A0A2X0NTC4_9BASI|nr:BQ5605_C011g06569 [Microbotryum silenes-dioicae]